MSLQLIAAEIGAAPSHRPETDVDVAVDARQDRWIFCVGCAIAVPTPALHQHLRICSGTTSA